MESLVESRLVVGALEKNTWQLDSRLPLVYMGDGKRLVNTLRVTVRVTLHFK